MRRIFTISAVATLLFLVWFLAQSRLRLSSAQDERPKSEGEGLAIRKLAPMERVLIVIHTKHGFEEGDTWDRLYQIEGGAPRRFGVRELDLRDRTKDIKQDVVVGTITDEEALGLDSYILFLRRWYGSTSHRIHEVTVGYYRDGKKIGEERFVDRSGIFHHHITRDEVPDLPEITPPWEIERRLKKPNKSPEPTPGTVTPRADVPTSR